MPTKTASKPCVEEVVDGDVLADPGVADELHADVLEVAELVLQDLLAELEVRDAVQQHAAGLGPGVVNGAGVAVLRQLLADGEAGGPGADDGDLVAGGRGQDGQRDAAVLALVVGDERLELADRDGRLLVGVRPDGEGDDALALAEALLRAEAAAQLGQVAGLAELVGGAEDVAVLKQLERAGDVVADGAGVLAGRGRALDAAHRLDLGGLEVEAEEDFVPVVAAFFRVLLVDGDPRDGEALLDFDVPGHGRPSFLRWYSFLPGA